MIKNTIFDIGGVTFDDSDLNLSKLLNKDNLNKEETIFFDDKEKTLLRLMKQELKLYNLKNVKDIYDNITEGSDKNE